MGLRSMTPWSHWTLDSGVTGTRLSSSNYGTRGPGDVPRANPIWSRSICRDGLGIVGGVGGYRGTDGCKQRALAQPLDLVRRTQLYTVRCPATCYLCQ